MSKLVDLLKKIYPLRVAPNSPDTDKMIELIKSELDFKIHTYAAALENNGWVVPASWSVVKAEIKKDGKLVYDGLSHPLGVIGYSDSFKGTVNLDELKKHIFVHPTLDDALVYHCDLYYKVGQCNWGFSMPRLMKEKLTSGVYAVDLQVNKNGGAMKVADYFLKGESEQTIILNAHNCHAGQANDDMSGVVVGIEVMKQLAKRSKRKYSYRLIIAPEHFGTVFYLSNRPEAEVKTFLYCIFLEMLGNDNRFALQDSFTGKTLLDQAAHHYLGVYKPGFFSDKFRKVVGNDETVWEAPGFEIPTISLSRFPYPQYHSSKDTYEIISEERLQESVDAVLGVLDILEKNSVMNRHFKGLVALSNPKYNLYFSTFDPSIRPSVSREQKEWNYLMDCLPRYFDGKTSLLEIAEKHNLAFADVFDYVKKFEEKGLVSLRPAF